jgi:hypothetical protein
MFAIYVCLGKHVQILKNMQYHYVSIIKLNFVTITKQDATIYLFIVICIGLIILFVWNAKN